MRKRLRTVALDFIGGVWLRFPAAVTLALVTATSVAAQGTGTITVVVRDTLTDAPVAGAAISVVNTPIGGLTDEDGRTTLFNVPSGERTLRVDAQEFGTRTPTLMVRAGETVLVTMRVVEAANRLNYSVRGFVPNVSTFAANRVNYAVSGVASQATAEQQSRPANLRLTFHLIEANGFNGTDPEIEEVVNELRRIFRFEGYRLAAKSVLNAALPPRGPYETNLSQMITDDQDQRYYIAAKLYAVDDQIRVEVSLHSDNNGSLIDASVNLQPDKSIVLGSANGAIDRGAFILVVTPTFDP